MAFVQIVDEADATGPLARAYDAIRKRAGRVFNIVKVQSLNPKSLQGGMGLYVTIMMGESHLTRAQREMLAVVVSRVNECHY